jgi:hypothetical protein
MFGRRQKEPPAIVVKRYATRRQFEKGANALAALGYQLTEQSGAFDGKTKVVATYRRTA